MRVWMSVMSTSLGQEKISDCVNQFKSLCKAAKPSKPSRVCTAARLLRPDDIKTGGPGRTARLVEIVIGRYKDVFKRNRRKSHSVTDCRNHLLQTLAFQIGVHGQ